MALTPIRTQSLSILWHRLQAFDCQHLRAPRESSGCRLRYILPRPLQVFSAAVKQTTLRSKQQLPQSMVMICHKNQKRLADSSRLGFRIERHYTNHHSPDIATIVSKERLEYGVVSSRLVFWPGIAPMRVNSGTKRRKPLGEWYDGD